MQSYIFGTLFLILAITVLYGRLISDWFFRELGDRHPKYYEKIGRPALGIFSMRRVGLAHDFMRQALMGKMPKDFPDDKNLMKRIDRLQMLVIIGLVASVGIVVTMIVNFNA